MALIIDTGPLYACMDRRDSAYVSCSKLIADAQERRIVPAPVLVEVDYFVRKHLSELAHAAFLRDITDGAYAIMELRPEDYIRVREICAKYSDQDIGLVDASVIAIAERLGEPKVATLDRRHFSLVRPRHVEVLELLPTI